MTTAPLVVVGAGLAGWTTVREFRKLDTTTQVVLITQDSGDFYAKPSLSNAFAQKRTPAQLVTTPAEKMAQTLQVTLLAHTRVVAMEPASRTLHLEALPPAGTAATTLTYHRLVLATGAAPIRIPLQGDAADRVMSVNSLDDFSKLFSALGPYGASADSSEKNSKRLVIMGAGLIGCEFANDLSLGGHCVHLVDPTPRPLAALMPPDASIALQTALHTLGVQFQMETTVASVNHRDNEIEVTLANGTAIRADVVLSAIGLRADMGLAQAAGLQCDRGIVVDNQLRTSDPRIYALGDNAQYASAAQRTLPSPADLVFPLMPVSVKTPALPIAVSPPAPGLQGQWSAPAQGTWVFHDLQGVQRGFVLAGTATSQRMAMVKETLP